MIKVPILIKSLQYIFLPTIALYFFLMVAFGSFLDPWYFLISNSGWAIFTRLFIMSIEVSIVVFMYVSLYKNDKINRALDSKIKRNFIDKYSTVDVRNLFKNPNSRDTYEIYSTEEDEDIIVVYRIKAKKDD